MEGPQAGEVLAGVRHRDLLRGQAVRVFAGALLDDLVNSGTAEGIGDEGQLLVRGASGEVTPVFAGDVTLRGPADASLSGRRRDGRRRVHRCAHRRVVAARRAGPTVNRLAASG